MLTTNDSGRNREATWVMCALIVIAAVFAFYFANVRFGKGEWDKCPFTDLMNGKALTPFQYRVLIPATVGWMDRHVLPLPGIANVRKLTFLIEVGAIFLAIMAFRQYLHSLFRKSALSSVLAITILFILPFNYSLSGLWTFWLSYDIPAVLFFTLGLMLLYRRSWALYYLVFTVGTLNKETTCFLTFVYLVTAWGREQPLRIGAHCLAQAAIWLTIKAALYKVYAGNPGGELGVYYAASNIRALLDNPRYIAVLMSSLGFIWLPVTLFYSRIQDPFVRRATWVGPVYFLGMVLKANLPELRIYGELIPVYLPAFLMIVGSFLSESRTSDASFHAAERPESRQTS